MADLGQTFDPTEVPEDERSFAPLPAGDYLCQVVESDVAPTKSGSGELLKLTIEVMDGPFSNRKLWENLNIRNDNPDAQRIAQRALADLCQAVGVGAIRNSEELHFKPFVARVDLDKKDPERNRIKRYKPRPGSAAAAPSPTSAPSAAARPTGTAQPSGQARPSAPVASPSKGGRPWDRPSA
jgi:hypothetical protein